MSIEKSVSRVRETLTYLNSLQDAHVLDSHSNQDADVTADTLKSRDFPDKISYAFQLATAQGPLCHEPMQGIAVFLEEVTVTASSDEESSAREKLGRLTGEIIKIVRESIRQGFLDWSPRLLLAMYSCEIQASSTFSTFRYDSLSIIHSYAHIKIPPRQLY